MSWLLSYSGKELHNIFSFLPILYHYIPFISRITIHLSHVSSLYQTEYCDQTQCQQPPNRGYHWLSGKPEGGVRWEVDGMNGR